MPSQHSPCTINLDDLGSQGTHWVCCFQDSKNPLNKNSKISCFKRKNTLYYFDSFGMPYPEEYKASAFKNNYRLSTTHFRSKISNLFYVNIIVCIFFMELWFLKNDLIRCYLDFLMIL